MQTMLETWRIDCKNVQFFSAIFVISCESNRFRKKQVEGGGRTLRRDKMVVVAVTSASAREEKAKGEMSVFRGRVVSATAFAVLIFWERRIKKMKNQARYSNLLLIFPKNLVFKNKLNRRQQKSDRRIGP